MKAKYLLLSLLFASLLTATIGYAAEPTISFPTTTDTDQWLTNQINRWYGASVDQKTTTLNGGINDAVTSVVVASAPSNWPASGYYIQVGGEYMYVEDRSSNTLTVTRGRGGSTAVSHSNGATVYFVTTAETFEHMKDSIQAIEDAVLLKALGLGVERVELPTGAWNPDINDNGIKNSDEAEWSPGAQLLKFDEGIDECAISQPFKLSGSYDGGLDIAIYYRSTAISNTVIWTLQTSYAHPDTDWSAYGAADSVSDTVQGAAAVNEVTSSSLTNFGANWDDNHLIKIKLCRDADTDTASGDVELVDVITNYDLN